jgi:hypothetical protein
MKNAKKTAKSPGKKKPAAAKKMTKPAAKKAAEPRATTGATAAQAPSTYTPGALQGIGWKPFRYPPE